MSKILLDWHGDDIREQATAVFVRSLNEFGARHETASRSIVKPGAGVLTGTYRRSIHAAGSGYNFARDNVKPSTNSPDRSGKGGEATVTKTKVQIVVGSGMKYAAVLEKRYAPIKKGHDRVKGQLVGIVLKHAKNAGFV